MERQDHHTPPAGLLPGGIRIRLPSGPLRPAPTTPTRRVPMYCWLALLAAALVVAIPAMPVAAADDKDPNLWLEEVTGEKALAWVKERNAESTAELTKSPEFQALNDRLLKILDSKDKIPFVAKRGEFYYNFWQIGR